MSFHPMAAVGFLSLRMLPAAGRQGQGHLTPDGADVWQGRRRCWGPQLDRRWLLWLLLLTPWRRSLARPSIRPAAHPPSVSQVR